MGIAIVHNDSTIIIDGLHDFYESAYLPTDSAVLKKILLRQQPFGNIVLIAITHRHNDHFDSALITTVANVHVSAILMGSDQIKQRLGSSMQKRVMPVSHSPLKPKPAITVIQEKIPHINPARHSVVDNIRFEINWDGFRIIHLGDADILPETIADVKEKPDVIIIPEWFLANEATLLLKKIRPANIIVTHISPSGSATYKTDPRTTIFRRYGDKIILKAN